MLLYQTVTVSEYDLETLSVLIDHCLQSILFAPNDN